MARKSLFSLPLVLLTLVSPGCGAPSPMPAANDRIKPSYNASTGRLERITYDRNGDGKVDAWVFMDGTAVRRAELDSNYDGVVDRIEYYGPTAAGSQRETSSVVPGTGALTKIEI